MLALFDKAHNNALRKQKWLYLWELQSQSKFTEALSSAPFRPSIRGRYKRTHKHGMIIDFIVRFAVAFNSRVFLVEETVDLR